MHCDLIIRGGRVLDGFGGPSEVKDVAVRGERIVDVGDLAGATADTVIDAAGMHVTPGFVDAHAHTDLVAGLSDDHLDIKAAGIRQGVTTEVCGNCGSSPFPLSPGVEDPFLGLYPDDMKADFSSLAGFRQTMAELPMLANLAPLLGHGALRASVVGAANRRASSIEADEMRRVVEQAMDDGAFGFSSGLIYAPGMFADTDELADLAAIAGRRGRPYATHMRDEGDFVLDAMDEAIEVGRRAGAGVQISHHKLAGRRNWGRSNETLAKVLRARAEGTDVTLDAYPYTAGSTFLRAALPPWVLDGGREPMIERLRDQQARDRISKDFGTGLPGWQSLVDLAGWESVVVSGEGPLAGRSIADVAKDQGTSASEALMDVLLDDPTALMIVFMMDQAEVEAIGKAEFALVGSDGVPVPGKQHPRLAGTFARVLRQAKGDDAALANLVRRACALPAERFHLPDRGVIASGMVADLVVFDAATVTDTATYEEPLARPVGISHVLLAGRFAVRDGELTDLRGGRVLEPAS